MKKFEPKMEFVRFMSEDLIATSQVLPDSSTVTVNQLMDIANANGGFSLEPHRPAGGAYGLVKADAANELTGFYFNPSGELVTAVPFIDDYKDDSHRLPGPTPNTWYHMIGDDAYVCGNPYEHIKGLNGTTG